MYKSRILYSTSVQDHNDLGVYGIFDTDKVHWSYYVISFNGSNLTPEICVIASSMTFERVKKWGKKVKDKQEGIEFITDYKDKWEMGTNDTRQENRDRKIGEVLDETKEEKK